MYVCCFIFWNALEKVDKHNLFFSFPFRFPPNGISDYSRPPSYRSRPSSAGQPSPVGIEDVELINNPSSTSSSHLPSDVISSLTAISSSASQNAVRSAPSIAGNSNHVEVVAEV